MHQPTNLPSLFANLQLEQLSDEQQKLIHTIDSYLPQTQCGLCGHADGCLPYAVAIIKDGELHNKCVPSGQMVSDKIAKLLNRPYLIAEKSKWQTDPNTNRPMEMRAVIREDDCIGCTKCIPACPVDAIIGTGKQMHTIFTDLCTGCELCIPPCPMDCIDLVPYAKPINEQQRQIQQNDLRQRYHAHLNRMEQQINDKHNTKPMISMVQAKLNNINEIDIDQQQAKNAIETAKIRTQIKKLEKQLGIRFDSQKQQQLTQLQQQLSQIER